MTAQRDISTFTRLSRHLADPLQDLRERGLARFQQVGLPTQKDEEWRFTNTDPLAEIDWNLPAQETASPQTIQQYAIPGSIQLVLVNGRVRQTPASLPKGLYIGRLSDAPAAIAQEARTRLATIATIEKTAFAALSAALLDEVAVVHVARGVTIEAPVHLISLVATAGTPVLSCPRVIVIVEQGASLRFAKTHAGQGDDPAFTNCVTEVFLERDAVVDHYHMNWLPANTTSITNTVVRLDASAVYTHHSATMSGKLVRNDVEVILDGEHADATLNGLVLLKGDRKVDNHTLIRHAKPNCTSHELYKHVVDEQSFGVFKGKILVQQDAQKTDSKQTSRTLLLSDRASMESMPALEIHADDVKCTHGSTTGPLDEQMLFYLRSRGLSSESARHLLIYAFAADMTQRMKVPAVRQRIENFLARQQDLPLDLSIEAR